MPKKLSRPNGLTEEQFWVWMNSPDLNNGAPEDILKSDVLNGFLNWCENYLPHEQHRLEKYNKEQAVRRLVSVDSDTKTLIRFSGKDNKEIDIDRTRKLIKL